ncbi:MAG: SGNH/GDSL hydrolase family protein [Candidatus Eisenbacteria bacterium]|uniref:SGNH/GDSL hydrolase family protein n=1 Tax=Eiseniibacteriota bacterium TaxID=2212470 RepID=A0A538S7Y6_UNCEI|nr:MAG: SGNH/GDSL hydrolase family protein [Candidatus Eisenbacteria bacterium]
MHAPSRLAFERYVAIGDSSTEGIDDPDGQGGYRGWSQRLAERIALIQGRLLYANLGVRGRTTRQIRDQQLAPALAMQPDLATVFSGTNDVLARRFDAEAVGRDMEVLQRALIEGGAKVLSFTLPDLTPVMPIARWIAPRVRALNESIRAAAATTGTILLDFAAYPVGSDLRLWSADRIHANAAGHARIADALAHALGLPGTDDSWKQPLPEPPPRTRREWLAAEVAWTARFLLPWPWRALRARLEEPRRPRQPDLRPV